MKKMICYAVCGIVSLSLCFPQERQAYEGRVGQYKGRNVFFIDDIPYAPLMYSGTEQGRKTWMDPTKKSIEAFTAQGYEIIQTDTWFKYLLDERGKFDIPQIQKQLASILHINPKAKIVLRINVSAPQWWLRKHPDETCKITNPDGDDSFGGNSAESLASELYRAFAKTHLTRFLKLLSETPESNHIVGYHIGGGVYGEWHYYGIRNEPDRSAPMKRRFADYAIKQYGSLAAANKVWHTDFAGRDDVEVPGFERRYATGDGDYRDAETDRFVIDYYRCQQETISSIVEDLAKITKETWPRPAIVGVFFGYLYGGFTVGAEAGQNDVERIFRSPYIDYFAGPYYSRDMNGSGCYRSLAASCALNGKIWLTEHDGGTHLGGSGAGTATFPGIPANEAQTIARMRRNYMYSLTENGGQWWYDFGPRSVGGGWWNTPGLMEEVKNLFSLSNTLLHKEFAKPADVLVVYDMDAYYYMRPRSRDKISARLTDGLADALLGTGVAFDKVFAMDLDKIDYSTYRTVLFANTVYVTEERRRFIKERIMCNGRHVIFMAGDGYTDGSRNSDELISSLVGMTIRKHTGDSVLNLMVNKNSYPVTSGGIESIFYIDDAQANVIGLYGSGLTGAAKKTLADCTVYYFGLPLESKATLYKDLFKEIGNRMYVTHTVEKDYVSVGGGIIGVYSVSGGIKQIQPMDGSTKKVEFQPYSCYYFDMTDGRQLNH